MRREFVMSIAQNETLRAAVTLLLGVKQSLATALDGAPCESAESLLYRPLCLAIDMILVVGITTAAENVAANNANNN